MQSHGSPVSPKTEDGKAWQNATLAKVDHVKGRADQVRQALADLEQREQDRIAAQIAEHQRQQAREEALQRKKQREALLRAEEERKKMLAAELQLHRGALDKMKADEKCALKAATARFQQKTEMDARARELSLQMKAMDNAVQQVGLTSSQCMHEGRMKFSSLKVCEMRLAMRAERPAAEAFKDEVDEALEKEHQTLTKAREDLSNYAKQGEQVRVEIQEVQSLLTTGPSRENVKSRLNKSSSLPLLVGNLSSAPSHEESLRRGVSLVERALDIDAKANGVLVRMMEECDKAAAHVTSCFQQRSSQTGDLKSKLEHHKKQCTATIKQAEQRLQMLKMRAHKTPETPRSAEATQEQMRQVEELIKDLREGKRNLEEDFRMKTSSFKVDRSCINLTKVKAGSHVGGKTKVTVME